MLPVFTFDEIREVERQIIEKDNVPSLLLMENAGKNTFDIIRREIPDLTDFDTFIVCGKGNNAGDGFVIARHFLINELPVTVVPLIDRKDLKGDALINYDLLTANKSELLTLMTFEQFKKKLLRRKNLLLIDAILGTGIKGKLDDLFSDAINTLLEIKRRSKNVTVVSVDVPSGLMSGEQFNPVVRADLTVTMGSYKTELLFDSGKENSGRLYVVPIGIGDELSGKYNAYNKHICEQNDIRNLFPKRKRTSHKYRNGKVLVIGGSRALSGAVIMSSLSAVKSGAGGVVAAIPKSIVPHFARKLYEVMKVELDETDEGTIAAGQLDRLNKRIDWADVVLLGPGISTNVQTRDFVLDVIENCPKNMVLDADALNLIASDVSILKNRKHNNEIILTPHLGEFSRLMNKDMDEIKSKRFDNVRQFVNEYNISLVLKSETSLCCSHIKLPLKKGGEESGAIFINSSGNEALATAGSGDVLSGIIASLFSQTNDVYRAMTCGSYLHGLCSDLYFEKFKNKQTATPQDFIKLIPEAVTRILSF